MAGVFDIAKGLLADGTLLWPSSSSIFRAMLINTSYVFNPAHQHVSDILSFEVSGGTYARVPITGRTGTFDVGLGRGVIDADDAVFDALTGVTTAGLVVYKQIGGDDSTPGNDPLAFYYDFAPFVANGTSLKFEFSTQGLSYLTS